MGLESRLGAVEEALVDSLLLEVMVEAEIQEMLKVLRASEDIEAALFEKVARILTSTKDARWPT